MKQKLKRGLEQDAVTCWRKVLCWRAGQRAKTKRILRRRVRHEAEKDILNWDAAVVAPPPKRKGVLRVHLVYKGRGSPPCSQ